MYMLSIKSHDHYLDAQQKWFDLCFKVLFSFSARIYRFNPDRSLLTLLFMLFSSVSSFQATGKSVPFPHLLILGHFLFVLFTTVLHFSSSTSQSSWQGTKWIYLDEILHKINNSIAFSIVLLWWYIGLRGSVYYTPRTWLHNPMFISSYCQLWCQWTRAPMRRSHSNALVCHTGLNLTR